MFNHYFRTIKHRNRVGRNRRHKGFIASNLSLIVGIIILVVMIVLFFHITKTEFILAIS